MMPFRHNLDSYLEIMSIQYKGAKWFKCDLHLHTPASKCFLDQQVTPQEWVEACLKAGLNCVAVTDHNTGAWIDQIKEVAKDIELVVFPGVEITCDTSKIHLLIIFDESKTTQYVEDFLLTCGITRDMFAEQNAHSAKTVIEIAKLANEKGALVIPAHIDEFNGLAYCASRGSVKDFLDLEFIHAVQFVHEEFLDPSLKVKDNQELLNAINEYYGKTTTAIGENDIKNAFDGIMAAKAAKMRLLTFSDNPDETNAAKHGLFGIGTRYSWIKMDCTPSLEGLRQAFMMPERTVHFFENKLCPYSEPSLWIRKVTVQNTVLTKNGELFEVEFNPQLTTIIGGRGSGKSSILRFLRGVFGKDKDLEDLTEIANDHNQFFKDVDEYGQGVLKEDTVIEVYFVRNGFDYRIIYDRKARNTYVEQYDSIIGKYNEITDEGFIDFFQFEEYSQKQIFSIAQKPNSLRNRIDSAIADLIELQSKYSQERQKYRSMMSSMRTLLRIVQNKGKVNTEIKDLNTKIELLKKSGIATLLTQQQKYSNQIAQIKQYLESYKALNTDLKAILPELESFKPFAAEGLEEKYRDELSSILVQVPMYVKQADDSLKEIISTFDNTRKKVVEKIMVSTFYQDAVASKKEFEKQKAELESKGVKDMTNFEAYNQQIEQKKKELEQILKSEKELEELKKDIESQIQLVAEERASLSQKRQEFVSRCINSDKIKVSIRPYYDKSDFVAKFRSIVQKGTGYDKGIDKIAEDVYSSGNIETNLQQFKDNMHALHDGTVASGIYDGWITNLIQSLTPDQMDNIDLLYPEDQIEMRYKGRDGNFKPLTVASAGQKTTAILTFILSFGNTPLVLDQPEDDLDNRLVYDLIVDKIRQIKEFRQVIVVTHNANIPVNGDAEYVVSMSSETHNLKIQAEGTVENDDVKNEICEVMEGGVEAFKTRAKRYQSLRR